MQPSTGARRLGLRVGLVLAVAAMTMSLGAGAAQAGFTTFAAPCSGGQTAGRGATFPALLQTNYWAPGFNGPFGCGGTPPAPGYNVGSFTPEAGGLDGSGTPSNTGSGAGISACGGGGNHMNPGFRDTSVRFCATDDPVTAAQLANIDNGNGTNGKGLIHQMPWASGAIGVIAHIPEGCHLPDPGTGATPDGANSMTGYGADLTNPTDPSGDKKADNTTRPLISNLMLEKAFAGDPSASTWGQLIPGISGTTPNSPAASGDTQDENLACSSIPVVRIVRQDTSGTTQNFKSFLSLIAAGLGADPTNGWLGTVSVQSGKNTFWPTGGNFGTPFDANASGNNAASNGICNHATVHICGGNASGAGQVAKAVLATDGSIGYADVATDVNTKLTGVPGPQSNFEDYKVAAPNFTDNTTAPRDYTFWLPIQSCPEGGACGSATFKEPTLDPTNHLDNGSGTRLGTQGANCNNLPNLRSALPPTYTTVVAGPPAGTGLPNNDPTFGDWSHTFATGGSGYPACVLTYGLIWDDNSKIYGNTPAEESQARTVLDYVKFIASDTGQAMTNTDFSTTPAAVRTIFRNAVAAIDWNKTSCTSNCTTSTNTNSSTTTTTTTTKTTTTISNRFTVSAPHVKKGKLQLTLKFPGRGKLQIKATFKIKSHHKTKTITFATLTHNVNGGTAQVTLVPTGGAVSALKTISKHSHVKVTLKITFTPSGGRANTVSATLSVVGLSKH